MHGGNAAKGLAHGRFKHGRYSRDLQRLRETVGARAADPEILEQSYSIAAQEAVLARCVSLMDEHDSPKFRETARKLHREAVAAQGTDDAACTLGRLGDWLDRGAMETRALSAARESAEGMSKAQARYWGTLLNAKRAISPEQFQDLIVVFCRVLEEDLGGAESRRLIARIDREVMNGSLGVAGPKSGVVNGNPRYGVPGF